jgi:hypothetical protein
MSEDKKEGCCGGSDKSGCCGVKKIIVGVVLAALLFTCGYIFGKGGCPFSGMCQTCPMTKK